MLKQSILPFILMTMSCLGASAQTMTGIRQGDTREYRKGQLIVKFKQDHEVAVRPRVKGVRFATSNSQLNHVLNTIGAKDMTQLMPETGGQVSTRKVKAYDGSDVEDTDLSQLYMVEFSNTTNVDSAVNMIAELDEVEFAEPNYIVHAQAYDGWGTKDPLFIQQWGTQAVRTFAFWKASANAENKLGPRPVIAILDTGVDIAHPDLADNIWTNDKESENGADDDGNGYKDDLHGWDFVNQTGKMGDYNGHGTHCAGIAAAVGGNGIGIAGANPDALIMPVTIMQSNGTGDVATIIKGIDYAVKNGADVINMSFGGYDYSIAEEQALGKAYSKCVLVASAGNDGKCITESHPHPYPVPEPMYPAAFTYVLGVMAAGNAAGSLASYSNYDDDGPTYSEYNQEKLYNYELTAPGSNIISTYPGGRYKSMSGTSMASPLVAGIVSRLIQTKEYLSKEMLFGDLIKTSSPMIDALAAYNLSDEDRVPEMQLLTVDYADSLGDGDGRVDAGETVDLYPTLRNYWGQTHGDIIMTLEFAENEDTTLCQFIDNGVALGMGLSGYGKAKSLNPLRIKMRDNIADGRIVRLQLRVKCENMPKDYVSDEFTFKVENGVELGGTQKEDITLYPGIQYIVTRNWGIPKDRTVTVKAGTTIKIKDNVGISNYGYMLFEGTADSMITITKADNDLGNINGFLNDNTNYVAFNYVIFDNLTNITFHGHRYNNCIIRNCKVPNTFSSGGSFRGCEIYNNEIVRSPAKGLLSAGATFIETSIHDNIIDDGFGSVSRFYHSNYIGNEIVYGTATPPVESFEASNMFGNYYDFKGNTNPYYKEGFYSIVFETTEPEIFYLGDTYLGTANDKEAYKSILDSEDNIGWGTVDVWQKLNYAAEEAPVCVDYVKVDGYNPLDEADSLPPLGVGTHTIEVGFNRSMDQSVEPFVGFGVRPPYTQHVADENGYWFDPYTYRASFTINGRSDTDGYNRIRVYGYRQKNQNPEFGAPDEKYRYNINISAAGSMSTGLMAEAGLGKVMLTWETDTTDFTDLMGYNIYRFEMNSDSTFSDSVMVNDGILEDTDTAFTDYDVVPGNTYYYYIKEIGTDLQENYVSSTVAATPLTAQKGDANGSLQVDIADVLTEIAYLSNENPQPFIYEAADVNCDDEVNILDVVATLRIITSPDAETEATEDEEVAYCYVEDNTLHINSPIALGGIQVRLESDSISSITTGESLYGLEQLSAQVNPSQKIFLAYSMSGEVIPAGDQEIMLVDDAPNIKEIVLSTPRGANVNVVFRDPTGISEITNTPQSLKKGIYDLTGRKLKSRPAHGIVIIDGKKVKL